MNKVADRRLTNGGLSSLVSERRLMNRFEVSYLSDRYAMGHLWLTKACNRVVPHNFPHNVGLQ